MVVIDIMHRLNMVVYTALALYIVESRNSKRRST